MAKYYPIITKMSYKYLLLVLSVSSVMAMMGCDGSTEEAIQEPPTPALGKGEQVGALPVYWTRYINLVISGKNAKGPVVLLSGAHKRDFPYFGDNFWENGLLYVNGKKLRFTHVNTDKKPPEWLSLNLGDLPFDYLGTTRHILTGHIKYQGTMEDADAVGKAEVLVDLTIPVSVLPHEGFTIGRPPLLESVPYMAGQDYKPYTIKADPAGISLTVNHEKIEGINGMLGCLETGNMNNLTIDAMAVAYDYLSVVEPEQGYSLVHFAAHPLDRNGILSSALEWFMERTAKQTVTYQPTAKDWSRGYAPNLYGNVHEVQVPSDSDSSIVLFENVVDLKLANLHRQMVKSKDQKGKELYGLREIFIKKDSSTSGSSGDKTSSPL